MSNAATGFHIGQKLVLPGLGVARVEARDSMEVEGQIVETMRLRLLSNDSLMWLPVDRIDDQGLRPVMSPDRAEKTLEIAATQEAPKRRAHWNQRRRRYEEQLMSNRPRELAKLLGELAAVRARKSLTMTEKHMFRKVRALLSEEVAAALDESRERVEERLERRLPAPAAA